MSTTARRLIAITLATSLLGSCAGYLPVAAGPAPPARPGPVTGRLATGPVPRSKPPQATVRLAVGQRVCVELRDGTKRTITITAMDADAVIGERGERIPRAQIAWVTGPTTLGGHLKRLALLYGGVILLQAIFWGLYEE